ncbi:MAG TPA: hypothetical protein VIK30_14025, partial [Polyangia bacterium]
MQIVDGSDHGLEAAAADWDARAALPSPGFAGARAAAHWAAQIVAAAGWTLAAPKPDHSHGALEWVGPAAGLLGVEVNRGGRTARAGLRLRDLTLLALSGDSAARNELPLTGQTLDTGLTWLGGALARILGDDLPRLERPSHELPVDPIGDGASFGRPETVALEELGAWFSSADRVLRAIAASTAGASPVRCWPHHFDIATLIRRDGADAPTEITRSIGVGLSPGNGSYAEPYWYVTPWPTPARRETPPLPHGHWHTQGWFGAVLPATAFVAGEGAAAAG